LYEAGLERREILELYRLLDWLMGLPDDMEREYKEELRQFEQSRIMPYVTSIERIGREEGRQEGLQKGREEGLQKGLELGRVETLRQAIMEVIEARFEAPSQQLRRRIQTATDSSKLQAWLRLAARCTSVTEFEQMLST
jgi:predicted transposase YdaD